MTEGYFAPPQPEQQLFMPPDDALEGSDMDIARRWVERSQADWAWREASGDISDGELLAKPGIDKQLAEQAAALQAGDEQLAARLAHRALREVEDLLLGERVVVAGQAHLLAARQQALGTPEGFFAEG